uniref:Pheromone-binding protein Gp-9 n=1 Tax=Solenopsis invicta TaxID=13686 RepID=A0A6B9CKG9_SOLIN|nr:OBP12b' [Solenopsis invicta]
MKHLVLCACVLLFTFQLSNSSELKQKFQEEVKIQQRIDFEACLSENGINESELYGWTEILSNVHTETANEERTRKNGCFMACFLKKQNLMEGTSIKEDEVIARLDEVVINETGVKLPTIVHKCIKEKKDITQECDKCFSIYVCIIKAASEEKKRMQEENVRTEEEETGEPNKKK